MTVDPSKTSPAGNLEAGFSGAWTARVVSHLSVSRPLLVLPKSQDVVRGRRKKGEPFEDATGCNCFNVLGQPRTSG